MYGWGHNEELLGRALQAAGATRWCWPPSSARRRAGRRNGVDGRPAYVKQACEASLKRLGVDVIDLYYQHRVDPRCRSRTPSAPWRGW